MHGFAKWMKAAALAGALVMFGTGCAHMGHGGCCGGHEHASSGEGCGGCCGDGCHMKSSSGGDVKTDDAESSTVTPDPAAPAK